MANYCFSVELMPESMRQALILLLFKKEDPELLKNWHPISLLNTDYKIITKVLDKIVLNLLCPRSFTRIDAVLSLGVRVKIMRLSYVTYVTIWKLMNEWPALLY
jgi:hypothetical protein